MSHRLARAAECDELEPADTVEGPGEANEDELSVVSTSVFMLLRSRRSSDMENREKEI
jgi:hypothetical protein